LRVGGQGQQRRKIPHWKTPEDFTMSIRLAVAVMAVVALFGHSARADVTFKSQDGALELTLPNGWHQAKETGAPGVALHVAGHAVRVTVREHAKQDFKDIKSVATFLSERLKKKLTDAEPKFEDVQVNGKPAIRVDVEGTEASGVRVGYLITVFEADAMYISIAGTGTASAFAKQKEMLAGLANQLKVTAATGAAQPPASPPAAAPPAAASPAAAPPAATPPTPTKPRAAH
jgi:hypothetical protein